ncbi:MAG: tRNA pseudouridine(38-40) synthase TruA [Anaerolineae bacterium]|jgi:tRNA pseudouridine38-40 synthase
MRVRALVAYDGTDYNGFQRQVDVPTVQETLEKTLAQVTQESVTVWAAGRTDAGVHALGQVIAFDTSWRHGMEDLQRAMNAVLPPDVAVRELGVAGSDFHPRFDARSRLYQYRIHNAPVRSPIARRHSLHMPYPLDTALMQRAAESLVGEHDFATFGQAPQGEVTVRRVFSAVWGEERCDCVSFDGTRNRGRFLTLDIEANAFLYRMVRSIVGTLLDVGQGRMRVSAFGEAFASCDRSRAGKTAAPHGLCLVQVNY